MVCWALLVAAIVVCVLYLNYRQTLSEGVDFIVWCLPTTISIVGIVVAWVLFAKNSASLAGAVGWTITYVVCAVCTLVAGCLATMFGGEEDSDEKEDDDEEKDEEVKSTLGGREGLS